MNSPITSAIRTLAAVVILATSSSASAGPSDLDPLFTGGRIAPPQGGATTLHDAALSPDGKLVVYLVTNDGSTLIPSFVRFAASGELDHTFQSIPGNSFGTFARMAASVLSDGRIVTARWNSFVPEIVIATRHHPDGALDLSYALNGVSALFNGVGMAEAGHAGNSVVFDGQGRILFGMYTHSAGLTQRWVVMAGPAAQQQQLIGLASNFGTKLVYGRLAFAAGDAVVGTLAGRNDGLLVARLTGAGVDASFGSAGYAFVPLAGSGHATDIAVAPDGSVIVAGIGVVQGRNRFVAARLKPTGQLDESFGENGVASIEVARADEGIVAPAPRIALQPDGRIVLVGTVYGPMTAPLYFDTFTHVVVARLTASGRLDTRFAPGGVAKLWEAGGASAHFVRIRPDGRILVGGDIFHHDYPWGLPRTEAAVFQLQGGNGTDDRPLRERRAVEYFHAGQAHYFITADVQEIMVLDVTPSMGWLRTGRTIRVWDENDGTMITVCRFWSDQTWAPKSSHFYTPYEHECAQLKHDPAWRFERDAFLVKLPEGTPGARTCPADSQPLYRAYNDSMSGAPNHRYTTDAALLDQLIAQGWIMEGEAQTRVFACVPLQ